MYQNISGFGISHEDERRLVQQGGVSLYGEILYDSFKTILDDLPAASLKKTLYDLGSGVGKVCVQAYLAYPFKKVIGVELSQDRFNKAESVLDQLKKERLLDKKRSLIFLNKDFTQIAFDPDTSVIYIACFAHELMEKLMPQLAALKKGLFVITLKTLPHAGKYGFKLVREYRLPMSWSTAGEGSVVNVFKLM